MHRVLVSLALCFFPFASLACSSSDSSNSGPTGPSVPTASLQGTWEGTATSESVSGTCLAANFTPLTVSVRWVFQQSGNSFTGQQTLNSLLTCPFRGTVSGNTATFFVPQSGGPGFCRTQVIPCPNDPFTQVRIELPPEDPAMTATISGNTMTGVSVARWRATNANTGQPLGTYEARSRQNLTKQ